MPKQFEENARVKFTAPTTGEDLVGVVTKAFDGLFVTEREVRDDRGNFYWVKCINMIALPEISEEGELL